MAFVSADPGWVFCECRKENSDAGLRSLGDADRIGVQWPRTLAPVRLIGLAAAAHQGFSANLFTTASDMFPREAVASVVGIGGMAGGIGGMLIAKVVGYVLQATGSDLIPFLVSGSA